MEKTVLPHPSQSRGSIFELGGAEVWHIAGTEYLSGSPKKAPEEWSFKWFYIDHVSLPDPVRIGIPEFSNAPLKKRHSWRPRGSEDASCGVSSEEHL